MSEPLVSLTLREAIDLTKQAIREKGWDYVYPYSKDHYCRNFEEDGSPSCVVGYVLSYRGVTLQGLKLKDAEWDEETGGSDCDYNRSDITVLATHPVYMDDQAQVFLNCLQFNQDAGSTWGNAYILALRELYRYRKSNWR